MIDLLVVGHAPILAINRALYRALAWRGWTVEIAFPWSAFASRAPVKRPAAGDEWRLNFSRVEWHTDIVDGKYRKVAGQPEDNWVWSPQGVINMHVPARWGYVRFAAR